jgi:hypothetical protein
MAAGLRFVAAKDKVAALPEEKDWRYGFGEYDATTQRMKSFEEFRVFANEGWQEAAILPAPGSGIANLRARSGEPGEGPKQAVVRRWVSPVAGSVEIEGTLIHRQPALPYGDGVRGRMVSSRRGLLGEWLANGKSVETKVEVNDVEAGETIDFVVDGNQDPERDGFTWLPVLKSRGRVWSAKDDFRGPPAPALDVWARYAQVLLETNEFAFVD